MGYISDSGYLDIVAIISAIAVCIITYFKWSFAYWERKNVPFLKPRIPWGTLNNIIFNPISLGEITKRQYFEAKEDGHKFVGLFGFTKPIFMPIDPLIIKHFMLTDFKSFMDRGIYVNEEDDPLSAHLFSIGGIKWRNLRAKLTPTFTTGKMKMMFSIIIECGDQLKEAMDKICLTNEPVDIKDVLGRFTTNIIGSTAFGIDCNTFSEPNSEFRKYGKKVFSISPHQLLKQFFIFLNPEIGRRLHLTTLHKDVSQFFMQVITKTVDYREKNHFKRNDFMQLLINLKNGVHDHDQEHVETEYRHDGTTLTLEELAAQAFVFFIAGFETSSTTMTFCLFELAINQEIQDKVRCEVEEVLALHNGKLSYEAIHDMKYLGQVIDETLRKYPPFPVLNRRCTIEYKIPDTNVIIEKGTPIFIPAIGLHHDPEYFPRPETFDPDRFSEENKHNVIPHTYLPFGDGPRVCIGIRFGVMQTKAGLAILLRHFKFTLNIKTKIPLKMDPASVVMSTDGDMWLNVEKI